MATPLLGREDELALARRLLAAGQVVVVVGAAGIGKSAFLRAAATGPAVLVRAHPADRRTELPGLRGVLSGGFATAGPPDLDRAVGAVLSGLAGRLLVVDDLHLADASTLGVVELLARSRVPVLVSARPGAGEVDLVLRGAVRLELGPLDTVHGRAVVERSGGIQDRRQLERLLRFAAGNPLLLTLGGRAASDAQSAVEALRAVVLAASASAQTATARLALLGRPSPAPLVGRGAAAAHRAGLVERTSGLLALRHELLGEAALAAVGPERVRRLALELVPVVAPVDRARLLVAAGNPARAREAALRAARGARTAAARAAQLELAAQCGPSPPGADVALDVAREWLRAGRYADAARWAQRAGSGAGERAQVRALLVEAKAHWLLGDGEAATARLHDAATCAGGSASADGLEVRVEMNMVALRRAGPGLDLTQQCAEVLEQAVAVDHHVVGARTAQACALFYAGRPGWRAELHRALDQARRDRDDQACGAAAHHLASFLGLSGEQAAARAVAAEHRPDLGRAGEWTWWMHLCAVEVLNGVVLGDRDLALSLAPELLRDRPSFRNRLQLDYALVLARADVGQLGAAAQALEEAATWATLPAVQPGLALLRAELAWTSGQDGIAHDLAAGTWPTDDVLSIGARLRVVAAHAAVALGRPVDAAAIRTVTPSVRALTPELEGLRAASEGRWASASAALQRAAALWRGSDERNAVRALWAAGEVARSGGLVGAEGLLLQARAAAQALGLRGHERRADGSLTALSRRHARTVLSDRQREVLTLAAAGQTSLDIAERLGLAVSTVDAHVAAGLRKAGLEGRDQAHRAIAVESLLGYSGTDELVIEALALLEAGATVDEAAEAVHVSRRTLFRRLAAARRAQGLLANRALLGGTADRRHRGTH